MFPSLPALSDMPRQLESNPLPPLPSQGSQSDLGATHLNKPQPHLNLKRNSSSGPGINPIRQSTLGVPMGRNKRTSGIGVASSPGRLFKVLGDFFLLSGRTEDAAVWYVALQSHTMYVRGVNICVQVHRGDSAVQIYSRCAVACFGAGRLGDYRSSRCLAHRPRAGSFDDWMHFPYILTS